MGRNFGVYASGRRVYSGDFSEVPEPYRGELVEAIEEWSEVMVGWGLNELVYSFLCWHEEKVFRCGGCGFSSGVSGRCADCGAVLEGRPKYERNEKISRLLMCVGSIERIVIEESAP